MPCQSGLVVEAPLPTLPPQPRRRRPVTTPPPVPSCFARTSILSPPGNTSRLPVLCKSPPSKPAAIPLPSAPALGPSPPSSSSRLDERRAARDARPRPWSDRSPWAPAKPRSVRPSAAELAASSLRPRRLFPVTDPHLQERRRARQERDRPWAVSALPRLQSSTSPSAALSSAAAAPQHPRSILMKPRAARPIKKKVVWARDMTVIEVSRWIKEEDLEEDAPQDDEDVYAHMCF